MKAAGHNPGTKQAAKTSGTLHIGTQRLGLARARIFGLASRLLPGLARSDHCCFRKSFMTLGVPCDKPRGIQLPEQNPHALDY